MEHENFLISSYSEEETKRNDEKPIVAGVYLNRLKSDMRLQADPTVKFAIGDFTCYGSLCKRKTHHPKEHK